MSLALLLGYPAGERGGPIAGGGEAREAAAAAPPSLSGEAPPREGWSLAAGQGRDAWPLAAGSARAASLAGGEVHVYRVELTAGAFAELAVEQQGADAVVTARGPGDGVLRQVDGLNGAWGPEPMPLVAQAAGAYVVEVRALSPAAQGGRYRIRLDAVRPATAADRALAGAEDDLSRAAALRQQGGAAPLAEARALYRSAAARFAGLDQGLRRAEALLGLGEVERALGEPGRAVEPYRQALDLFRAAGEPRRAADALRRLGFAEWSRGEPGRAVDSLREALSIARRLGDRQAEAATLGTLGRVLASLRRAERAIGLYEEAIAAWRALGEAGEEGIVRSLIGELYASLGEREVALDHFAEALPLLERAGLRGEVARTRGWIGEVRTAAGDAGGLADLGQALALQRELGDRRAEANLLIDLGVAYRLLGHLPEAERSYAHALPLLRELGNRWSEATALSNLGWLADARSEPAAALAFYDHALALFRQAGDRGSEIPVHFGRARALRQLGRLEEARAAIELALAGIEGLRGDPAAQDLRTASFASWQVPFAFAVDLLMELDRREPAAGHDRAALGVAERARARSLLDALAEAGAGSPAGEASLDGEVAEIGACLAALERARREEPDAPDASGPSAALARERRLLLARYHRAKARERLADPRFAALAAPRPLSAGEVQQLLDGETVLLEYSLGSPRSYLWALTREEVASFELPDQAALDGLARRAHALLAASHQRAARGQAELALAELGRMLLAPAGPILAAKRRLLVVPDGALHYLPWGALPLPGLGGEPVASRLEVATIPSASSLGALRRQLGGRPPAPLAVAVFADPVFEPDDPRLQAGGPARAARTAEGPGAVRLALSVEAAGLARLPYARAEAEAILRLVEPGQGLPALGLDASLGRLARGDLSRYRILHFATHAVLDTEHPELSGILLSLVDEEGRPREGFLRAAAIADLDLGAELVVLSACETALGKEIHGEGMVGLTRSFMAAGAERVLVSLWRVEDRATAELMSRFYRALLVGRRPPAAALREAQLALREEPAWAAPYFWAGFVLQGDGGDG